MLGWINDCIEKLVIQKYGADTWHRIKKEAGCQTMDNGFFKLETYSDRSTYKLVEAASAVLGITEEEVYYAFGVFFAQYIREQGYETLLCCQGSTLKDWMTNINAIHHHIQTTFPKMIMPQFWCEDVDAPEDESLALHYYSGRGSFLAPIAEGLITEVASYQFNIDLHMEKICTQGVEGAKYSSWKVSTKDPQEQWKLREKIGGREGTYNDRTSFKCPFTGMTCPSDIPGTIKLGSIDEEELREEEAENSLADKRPFLPSPLEDGGSVSVLQSVAGPSVMGKQSDFEHDEDDDAGVGSYNDELDGDYEPATQSSDPVSGIGLSGMMLKQIFPYNIILNAQFTIMQVGNKLPGILGCRESDLVGRHVAEHFKIAHPIGSHWNWNWLRLLEEQSFVVTPLNGALRFKTTVAHLSNSPPLTMLIMNPDANSLEELREMKLTLSDLSVHGAYRDAIFLREHLSTQMKNALQLEKSAFEQRTRAVDEEDDTVAAVHLTPNQQEIVDYTAVGESKVDSNRDLDWSNGNQPLNLHVQMSMSTSNVSDITYDVTVASQKIGNFRK